MKYKVGDRVGVRRDLEVGQRYNGINVTDSMEQLAGQNVTIVDARFIAGYGACYRIEECTWNWQEDMFAGLEPRMPGTPPVISESDFLAILIGGGA